MTQRKYSHECAEKPRRGEWVITGGLLVELIEPIDRVRTQYGDKIQDWVGVTVDGSLIEIEMVKYRGQPMWELWFRAGSYIDADDAQMALLFGELP